MTEISARALDRMGSLFNIYCDESCHLENDNQPAMVLGAVSCPKSKSREIAQRIAEIKKRHKMPAAFEFKWTKVSPSKLRMYLDVIDYFFDDDDLNFRALVIPNKRRLNHALFEQNHDDWYYKMYFTLLKVVLRPSDGFDIYLDIKDTKSRKKVKRLHEVLCNNSYDFSRRVIRRVQQVRSHEVAQSQLADLLIGALAYKTRNDFRNAAKVALVQRIAERSKYSLDRSTLLREEKFNLFFWHGHED